MMRVTVDLLPFGSETRKNNLATIEITNTGEHPMRPEWGDYRVEVVRGSSIKDHRIVNHYRPDGWEQLLSLILREVMVQK